MTKSLRKQHSYILPMHRYRRNLPFLLHCSFPFSVSPLHELFDKLDPQLVMVDRQVNSNPKLPQATPLIPLYLF